MILVEQDVVCVFSTARCHCSCHLVTPPTLASRSPLVFVQVAAFVVENENFADLVGDCYICLEPLLNNIGTTKFGVVSWKCRCTVPQKAHTGCLFSKISLAVGGARCDMCNSPIKFEKTVGGRSSATIR